MKKNTPIIILLLTLVVGFAAVTASIVVKGSSTIGFNANDMQVIFTDVSTDGISDASISDDGKTITFDSFYLSSVGDVASLRYVVTNKSSNYDASVSLDIEYNHDNDYFILEQTKTLPDVITAGSSVFGSIKITLKKASTSNIDFDFKITINATPIERDSIPTNEPIELGSDPGLYDSKNVMLQSWDELSQNYSLDVSKDYGDYDDEDPSKLSNVIGKMKTDLALEDETYKLVLDSKVTKLGDYSLSDVDELTDVVMNDGLQTIGEKVFYLDDNITQLVFPESVTSMSEEPIGSMDNLKYIHFPSSFTNFSESMFDSCPSIENVEMTGGDYKTVDGVVYSKDGTKLLLYPAGKTDSSFTIPSSVSYIGDYAFEDSVYLTNVYFEDPRNWSIDSDMLSSNLLRDASKAVELLRNEKRSDEWYKNKLAPGLYNRDDDLVISWEDFENDYGADITEGERFRCIYDDGNYGPMAKLLRGDDFEGVVKIVIPEGVTSIGDQAFYNAFDIEVILLPNSLKSMGDATFFGCRSLRYIDIPDNVTTISADTFNYSYDLKELNIPKNVNYIGSNAFAVTGLTNAYFANPNGWSVDETAVDNLTSTKVAAQKLSELTHTWNRS